jgi:hypothetical protein
LEEEAAAEYTQPASPDAGHHNHGSFPQQYGCRLTNHLEGTIKSFPLYFGGKSYHYLLTSYYGIGICW